MPKAKDTIKVEFNEQTNEKQRTITLVITAPAPEFILADALCERGVYESLGVPLKQSAREALQGWLDSAEDLVKSLGSGPKKAAPMSKAKGREALPEVNSQAGNGGWNGVVSEPLVNGFQPVHGNGAGEVLRLE